MVVVFYDKKGPRWFLSDRHICLSETKTYKSWYMERYNEIIEYRTAVHLRTMLRLDLEGNIHYTRGKTYDEVYW